MASESTVEGFDLTPRQTWFQIAKAVGLQHGTLSHPDYLPGVLAAAHVVDAAELGGALEDAIAAGGVFP